MGVLRDPRSAPARAVHRAGELRRSLGNCGDGDGVVGAAEASASEVCKSQSEHAVRRVVVVVVVMVVV